MGWLMNLAAVLTFMLQRWKEDSKIIPTTWKSWSSEKSIIDDLEFSPTKSMESSKVKLELKILIEDPYTYWT